MPADNYSSDVEIWKDKEFRKGLVGLLILIGFILLVRFLVLTFIPY